MAFIVPVTPKGLELCSSTSQKAVCSAAHADTSCPHETFRCESLVAITACIELRHDKLLCLKDVK